MGDQVVCSGEQGDSMQFRKGFEVIDRVHQLLCELENYGEENVDWKVLLDGLDYFIDLPNFSFPPLYNIEDIEGLEGFRATIKEPRTQSPGMAFNQVKVYVDRDMKEHVVEQFRLLESRLADAIEAFEAA